MRRPLPIALGTGALMLVIALPALRADWTPVDSTVIPKGQSARTVADTVDRDFPGGQGSSPITSSLDHRGRRRRREPASTALAGVRSVSEPRALDGDTAQIDVLAQGEPQGATARALVGDDPRRRAAPRWSAAPRPSSSTSRTRSPRASRSPSRCSSG